MPFRDANEALLARQDALGEELTSTRRALAEARAENARLEQRERRWPAELKDPIRPRPEKWAAPTERPPRWLTRLAYGSAASTFLAGAFLGVWAPSLWWCALPFALTAWASALATLRPKQSGETPYRTYFGLMLLMGWFPIGGIACSAFGGAFFAHLELDRPSVRPYTCAAVTFGLVSSWLFLRQFY